MFSRLFGKKPTFEEIQMVFAQGRRHLWSNRLVEAKDAFTQASSELELIEGKITSPEIRKLRLQAQLGMWALTYFRDETNRGEYQRLCKGHSIDDEIAFFVATVFQIKKDFSPEAIDAYQTLLRLKPTTKLAQKLGEILFLSSPTEETLPLFETVVRIAKDVPSLRTQLCRWYVRLGKRTQAQVTAHEILLLDPENAEAHRCLGYFAELNQEWDTAIQHYRASGDWLRVVVAASKNERFSDAANALAQVGENERETSTWLFYAGWIAYRQGNLGEALRVWQRLQEEYPSRAASALNNAIGEHLTYQRLQLLTLEVDEQSTISIAPAYEQFWSLRRGAIRLILHNDTKGSKPLLQKAANAQRGSLAAATYYGLCAALDGSGNDASIYQYLVKRYGNASLFLWLRGLLLLRDQRPNATRYLIKAAQDGIFDRHLPLDAGRAANWLLSYLTNETLDALPHIEIHHLQSGEGNQSPFIETVLPSFVAAEVKAGANGSQLLRTQESGREGSSAWTEAKGIILASHRQWRMAIQSLSGVNPPLMVQVIRQAAADAVQQQDWQTAAEYIAEGLIILPDDPDFRRASERLRPFMWQRLWEMRELTVLDRALETYVNGDKATTAAYHQLAMVYTQIALKRDLAAANGAVFTMEEHRTQSPYIGILEEEAHNDYWQLAMGYWAVALSDREYWQAWARRRAAVYGEEVSESQVKQLIEVRFPDLLNRYHEEQSESGSKYASHHRYYAALIKREIELTKAMRYFLRTASSQRMALPIELRRYVSPLLIKEYGYEQRARQAVTQNMQFRLSPYEAELLRSAFSPISDVKALVEVKDYTTAVARIRWLLTESAYREFHDELKQSLITVSRFASAHFIDEEKWDEAHNIAFQGLQLKPNDKDLELTIIKAAIGWATERVRDSRYPEAIRRLEEARSLVRGASGELNQFLSETYVEWALEALREDDLSLTAVRLERAIAAYPTNARAHEVMSLVYHDKAVEKAQAGYFREALADAETAQRHCETPEVFALVAKLYRNLAIESANANDYLVANNRWERSRECAFKYAESVNTQESVDLFVQISVGYVMYLGSRQQYSSAIQIGEKLLEVDYNPDAISIDLGELLSAICTDYGASLYTGGKRLEGRRFMQKAVQYNPSNIVARQNLSRM